MQCGSYRIRLPTEKELEMKVSKTVRKMRYYESTLLSAYKVHVHAKLLCNILRFLYLAESSYSVHI